MPRGLRFRTRLFLAYLFLVFAAILLVSGWWFRLEETRIISEVREYLSRSVHLMTISAGDTLNKRGWDHAALQSLAVKLGRTADLRVTVIDRSGRVWGDSESNPAGMENHRNRPEVQTALSGKNGESIRFSKTLGTSMWYRAVPLYKNGRIVGVLRVAKPETEIQKILNRLWTIFYFSLVAVVTLAFLIGLLAMGRVTQPLMELEKLAKRFARGDLSGRARDFGQNELGNLGNAFNRMADRLSASIEEMREEKQKLQVILENMDDGLLVFDSGKRLEIVNRAAERLLGLERTKVIGRAVPELLVHPDLEGWMNEAVQSRTPVGGEFQTRFPEPRNIHVLAAPIEDPEAQTDGSAGGTIVLLRDLTRLRRLEQVRQDFVANVSHELRTPVTAIRVMAEALNSSAAVKDRERRFLEGILQETERMARIVDDLLILAQIDAGKGFQDPYHPFAVSKLINEVTAELGPRTKHRIETFLPDNLPLGAAHEDRIRQVLINLLENAQKYTPENGAITIRAALEEDGRIRVTVADTGPGIPKQEQERIFERFYRIDKARSRALGGTGLGLSIVKRIVEGYGGRVWVESEEGKGAAFSFTLPVVKG